MPGFPASTDYAKHEHITQVSRVSMTPDGSDCMIVLDQSDDDKFALTFPTRALKQIQASIGRLIEIAEQRDLQPGTAPIQKPGSFQIGHTDQIRGHVIVNFDPGTPNEKIFAILDADAVRMCQNIQGNVLARSSRPPSQRIVPPRTKLILPPSGGH